MQTALIIPITPAPPGTQLLPVHDGEIADPLFEQARLELRKIELKEQWETDERHYEKAATAANERAAAAAITEHANAATVADKHAFIK